MRIGVDLGGTKIEAVVLADDGTVAARKRIAAPQGDYNATIAAIAGLIEAVSRNAGIGTNDNLPAGIGIPGALSPATGLVKNANSTWLIGHPFGRDLETALDRPVRLANDANCLAVSEARDGAGAGHRVVFAAILGTGVGGGVAINGIALEGRNAIAGEWGHNPLPWPHGSTNGDERPGPACYCGQRGCIETFLSGPALVRDFGDDADVTAEEIAARAKSGEPDAAAAIERHINRLARALAGVINILDPDIIVLGGGLSKIDTLYDAVPEAWAAFVFSDRIDTPLVPAQHGDASGVRGAAWLWPGEGET